MTRQTQTSRRRFLQAAAATGALVSLNATVLAQDQDSDQFENAILFGGRVEGWQGFRLPEETLAETDQETTPDENAVPVNPTLQLEPGTTYTVLLKNLDGVPHTFAIQDSDGNNLPVLEPLTVSSDQYEALNVTAGETTPEETPTEVETTPGEEETTPTETITVEPLDVTPEISEQGGVGGIQFTASEEMAQYVCTVHPDSMVGDIQVEDTETTPDETTTE